MGIWEFGNCYCIMTILGIDPGFDRLGYALLQKNGSGFDILSAGHLQTKSKDEYGKRILEIGVEVDKIIKKHKPNMLAVEKLFLTQNQKTALKVSEVKGVIIYLSATAQIPCYEFTPLEIKLAVCGYGKADKKQVRDMLKLTLKNAVLPKNDDACDAIAVALTAFYLAKQIC